MSKNIVLFVDGTGNSGGPHTPETNTNVYQLHQLCEEDAKLQLYLAGVGTHTLDLWGATTGAGTKSRLRTTYDFLTSNYIADDNVFMFGFSRGAFAVRLLAGFLGEVGELFKTRIYADYLEHIYQIYEASVILGTIQEFRKYLKRLSDARHEPLPIHFLGVWDTVEEYYLSRDLPDLQELPSHIRHARQALALHERRCEMEPTLWTSWNTKSTVRQVWFPGAHADVGGGYPDGRLADAPLRWMQAESSNLNLRVKVPPANKDPRVLHQQRTGGAVKGAVVSRIRGESPRKALLKPEPSAIPSIEIDQTACDNLVDPINKIQFTGGDGPVARGDLEDIDKTTLNLLLRIKSGGRRDRWRAARTLKEVQDCDFRITACFQNPRPATNSFSVSLTLLLILGRDTDRIAQRLDNLGDPYVKWFEKELREVQDTLEGWDVKIPDRLGTSIKTIERRSEEIP